MFGPNVARNLHDAANCLPRSGCSSLESGGHGSFECSEEQIVKLFSLLLSLLRTERVSFAEVHSHHLLHNVDGNVHEDIQDSVHFIVVGLREGSQFFGMPCVELVENPGECLETLGSGSAWSPMRSTISRIEIVHIWSKNIFCMASSCAGLNDGPCG